MKIGMKVMDSAVRKTAKLPPPNFSAVLHEINTTTDESSAGTILITATESPKMEVINHKNQIERGG